MLAQYESHLQEDHGVVSDRQWKSVLTRDGITAYRKRHVSPRASDSSKVHSILAIGSIPGSVADLLFGSINLGAEASAAFNEVIFSGSVLGTATLAMIETPSRELPERSIALRWTAHGSTSAVLNRVITPRDYVVAEATGSTINALGERVGYRVLHSVNIPGAPELRASAKYPMPVICTETFFAFLYRQMSIHEVHLYITGRVNPKAIPTGVAVRATAEGAISLVLRTIEFAQLKKRTHLYRRQRQLHGGGVPATVTGTCRVCALPRGAAIQTSKLCQVCARPCCSACLSTDRVIRSAHARANRKGKALQKVLFCSQCLSTAHSLSAWDLAVAAAEAAASRDQDCRDTNASFALPSKCSP